MITNRRDFIATTIGAAMATVLARRPSLHGALMHRGAQGVFTPIRRDVGFFTMRGGTIGYLVNAGGVAAVDSQFPAEAAAFLEGLDARSGGRPVDVLLNTHHHGDHTGGNSAFRGVARAVVAHAQAAAHMRQPPGGQPPEDQLFPDVTFTDSWSADLGSERILARHHGRAHTSGDAVVTFEHANIVHMGDLMFHLRHPVVDGPAGATLRGWMGVLDRTVADHASDTIYIFGHAAAGEPVTGSGADLTHFRDYLGAVLEHVQSQVRAGRSRDEVLARRDPLRGFEAFGPFGQPGARHPLAVAYDEVTSGGE